MAVPFATIEPVTVISAEASVKITVPPEVLNCASFLATELDALAPRIIVPVGRVALRAIGLRELGYDPGPIRLVHAAPLRAGAHVILPLVHPSRISRAQVEAFVAAMRQVMGTL